MTMDYQCKVCCHICGGYVLDIQERRKADGTVVCYHTCKVCGAEWHATKLPINGKSRSTIVEPPV